MSTFISKIISIFMIVVHLALPMTAFHPYTESDNIEQPYPYVFIHGIAGWGFDDGMSEALPYWGTYKGKLISYLNNKGYECYNSSCGPISSAWDRACEIYAQLMGTTVDYGEAHSLKFGHARYGKTYEKPLFDGWSSEKKINIIAHSFGGATARVLMSLMAYGDESEQEASGNGDIAPLFTGGKADWFYSLTTLSSPHNGSTLAYALDRSPDGILMTALGFGACLTANTSLDYVYNFQLEQWGIKAETKTVKQLVNCTQNYHKFAASNDNAGYDLTLKGAKEINDTASIINGVYYYSYAACCTQKDEKTGYQVIMDGLTSIKTEAVIGSFSGEYDGFVIDEKWWPNDSMVNVISALAPFDEKQMDYSGTSETGIWMKMPVLYGWSHGSFMMGPGGTDDAANILATFYIKQFNIISETY